MDTELVDVDHHPGPGSKKGKADEESITETSDPVCNGERVNRNGLNSVSPENSCDSCESPSNMTKSESDTAGTDKEVKTNGVTVTKIATDGGSDNHNEEMNYLDNREPIVLCDEESTSSTDLSKGHSGANCSNVKPAKDSEKNSKQNCDTVPDVVENSAKVSKCESEGNSNGVTKKTGDSESGKHQDSTNDSKCESNDSKKSDELAKDNSASTADSSKKEADELVPQLSPRRSTRLSESKERSPKDENKENMEVTKTPDETPSHSPTPTPAESSRSQDGVQKGSRITRLMEQREGGELENMRPMAALLFTVGLDLARQQIFKDLIRVQNKKQFQNKLSVQEEEQLNKLKDAFDVVVTKNDAYVQDTLSCSECNFKTEARNVMEWHQEFAHDQDSGMYSCSFCDYQDRSPGNFFFHMEAEHNRRGRIYMRSPFYSCPLCPFENNSKASMNKHKMKCERHFKLKRNLEPTPTDCDIPLKRVKKPTPKQPVKKPQPVPQQQPPARTVPSGMSTVQSQRPLPPMPPLHRPPNMQRAPNLQRPQMAHNIMQGMPMVSMPGGSMIRQGIPPPVLQPQPGVQQYTLGGGMYTLINNNGQIIMQPAGMPAIPLGQSSMINANAFAQSLTMPLSRLQAQQQQQPQQQPQNQVSQSSLLANANKSRGPRPGTVASEIAKKKKVPTATLR